MEGSKFYVAQCLNIEVSAFGENRDEAQKNLKETIELYMEDASFDYLPEIDSPEITYYNFEHA